MDRQRFADEEGSRAAAHARNPTDWDMTPVLVFGALGLVACLVLLVGGATRTPMVARLLEALIGIQPHGEVNPDLCVAMGAAVQGGLLQGGGKLAGATGAAAQGLVGTGYAIAADSEERHAKILHDAQTQTQAIADHQRRINNGEVKAAAKRIIETASM